VTKMGITRNRCKLAMTRFIDDFRALASWRYCLKYKQENVTKNVGSKCPLSSQIILLISPGEVGTNGFFPCLAAGFGLFTNPMTG
jgi:hypothetical protein